MKPPAITFQGFILFLAIFILPAAGVAFPQDSPPPNLPLFQSDDLLSLTITMDMRKVLKDVGDKRDQHPAEISYLSPEGDTHTLPLKIKARGHFRRDPMNCDFPPLRLNFADTVVTNSIFEGQDKLKLVTHCRSRGTQYEQNVLKEYLVYRLYNLFTEESYRVRLVELSYADSRGKRDTIYKMGFIIEPSGQMVSRNQKNLCEIKNVQQGQCDPRASTRLSIFQYMVGNTDWSVPVPHNIDLIQDEPWSVPVAVPFDFDWCGLVDAPYAKPAENLGIDDVKTRVFRGLCRTEEEFELAFEEFRDKKEDIFHLIETVPRFSEKEKEKVRQYIEQFFSTLDSPRLVQSEFINACRTP